MFEIEALTKEEVAKELTVPYKGQVAHVKYHEDAMTGKEWAENLPQAAGEAELPFNVRFLCRVLASWDLCIKKKPIPITAEAMMNLPPRLVGAIAERVMADLFPNPTSPEATGSFS